MTMLAQSANYLRTGRVALFPKRGSFAAERPHPPTALARRKCRTGPSARRARGPQCHPRVGVESRGGRASAALSRTASRGYRGRATVHPHRRGIHSPMRHPALGRNPGRVEGQGRRGRRPWVLGAALLFVGRFGQQLVYLLFTQRERLGAHDHSDQLDPVAVTDPEQQGRRAGNSELLAFGDAALDRSRVFAALRAFLEGFSLIPTVFACFGSFSGASAFWFANSLSCISQYLPCSPAQCAASAALTAWA